MVLALDIYEKGNSIKSTYEVFILIWQWNDIVQQNLTVYECCVNSFVILEFHWLLDGSPWSGCITDVRLAVCSWTAVLILNLTGWLEGRWNYLLQRFTLFYVMNLGLVECVFRPVLSFRCPLGCRIHLIHGDLPQLLDTTCCLFVWVHFRLVWEPWVMCW